MQNNTSERILDSAHSLMSRLGYAGFSYADIAASVGISKASIHHHFPTKAELAVAVLIRHRTALLAGTETIDKNISVPLKRLRAYANYWEGCIEDGTQPFCVAALLAAEIPGLPEEVAAELRLHFEGLKRWIRSTLDAGVKDRSIRVGDSLDAEADAFMATMHGALLSSRVSGTCDVFRAIAASTLKKLAAPKTGDRAAG
jgi:TetR/AcrR family transcriptional repressor of nem operon